MSIEQIEAIDLSIKQATVIVEHAKTLERLRGNKDFKKVVLEGYFEAEAIRLVHLKADPNMQTETSQKSIAAQIDAIGGLVQYFNTVLRRADMAQNAIHAGEQEREELLAEEAE